MSPFSITAAYAFVPLESSDVERLHRELLAFGQERDMRGLVLLAREGINATVAGSGEAIAQWKERLLEQFGPMTFKDSVSSHSVFRRWSVKIKPEIVALKTSGIRPRGKHKHLSPAQWQAMLGRDDVVLVDARNAYEYALGKFRGAVNPGLRAFHQFPEWARSAAIPKDKKVLLYCTGGIRCEKAVLAMEAEGYGDVHQLDGGILGYLECFPHADFDGECFVFDARVAVDQDRQPSRLYQICPHCGLPGNCEILCACGTRQKICDACSLRTERKTCSKRCANVTLFSRVSPHAATGDRAAAAT